MPVPVPSSTAPRPVFSAVLQRSARTQALRDLKQVEIVIRQCRGLTNPAAALADRAAAALAAGGSLYFAGDPGFVAEAVGRAGGLMMAQGLGPPRIPSPHSVLVYGWKDASTVTADRSWLLDVRKAGNMVIGIGARAPAVDVSGAFDGTLVVQPPPRSCGLAAISNAVNLWDFTGELIGGLSRRGRTPSIWQSIWVNGSKERNAVRSGHDFDPKLTISPLPRGYGARGFTAFLLNSLHGLEQSVPQFEAAAESLDAARNTGHHARVFIMAHMVGSEIGGPEDPQPLEILPDPATPASLQPGDALLGLAYVGIPAEVEKLAEQSAVSTTWFAAPESGQTLPLGPMSRWIDARWRPGDTALKLPGYDVGALPPSGVLQLAAYCAVRTAMRVLQPTREPVRMPIR